MRVLVVFVDRVDANDAKVCFPLWAAAAAGERPSHGLMVGVAVMQDNLKTVCTSTLTCDQRAG